ncbi:acetyl-CoA carboxylase biotin carboxyl carrier protein [Paraliomyxa miuraensis]|uniref:acetyl-CoA carboxylase biotin carboxyl carrier protein n=1 Tax=Paraliomyxa miuraensis TaxID=376150 RepID=UPI002250C2AD|nr:biotin/lipoyl-containing protein [Paraliomyxa miuraensis]MCX4247604.1 hypothetical protein [Paraliomyxa miuraensis]
MKRAQVDGRLFTPELVARLERDGTALVLRSPAVGLWRGAPAAGSMVSPGGLVGELEILGVLHRLRAPDDAGGVVLERPGPAAARRAVAYDDELLRLDPEAGPARAGVGEGGGVAQAEAGGLVFRSPLSGRFYVRPAPGQEAFVKAGDVIEVGRTVALLEVMKTFNRVAYGGEGLPSSARVLEVVPADEADVDEDDVLLRVEPV